MESELITEQTKENGLKANVAWFGASFVLPFYSRKFYATAVTKSFFNAVFYFFVLMTVVTILNTGATLYSFSFFKQELEQAYESGSIPEISIDHGHAVVEGDQPMIFLDEAGSFIAIDTTGQIVEIDRTKYNQAFLLTETELHILDDYEYQIMPLRDLNRAFGRNTILIDQEIVSTWLNILLALVVIFTVVFFWIWNTIVKFMYLVGLGLLLWGLFSIFFEKVTFNQVVITGIYAHLPAMVLSYSLGLVNLGFVFQHTLLLLIIWVSLLFRILKDQRENRPVKKIELKPVLLGIPMAVFIALNVIFSWVFSPPYILVGTLSTIGILIVIEYRSNLAAQISEEQD